MSRHPVELQIEKADKAIVAEDFELLMGIYPNEAILVVEPGRNAVGKVQIRKAFEAIAAYFKNGLLVEQNGLEVLESGDTALVLANTVISGPGFPTTERKATYVFNKSPTGSRAYLAVRRGAIAEHRNWMVRNFSLTFAAVTLRLYLPASMASGVEFSTAYPVIAWLCWVPNLVFTEWRYNFANNAFNTDANVMQKR